MELVELKEKTTLAREAVWSQKKSSPSTSATIAGCPA